VGSTQGVILPRIIRIAGLVGILFAFIAVSAQAAPPSAKNPAGKIRGVVPAHGQASRLAKTSSNLLYHSGAVMHTNSVYAIYWVPSGYPVQSGYQGVINGFFGNVAKDSGQRSNVYFSDTQYYDTSGSISYNSSFKGAVSDTNAFPSNGCRDRYTSVCLTDAQLQSEIRNVISANGLPVGVGSEYFLFTPKNVASCYGSSCAYSYFCAYHSNFSYNGNQVLYANMPYAAYVSRACGSGQSPNGNDADSTINVTSHEHNETITDPLGNAWYDSSGNENGDKCAWNFGAPLGGGAGAEYNQAIGSGHYYLQQEWSNARSGCVLTGT
jgi:hypothetical protein